MAPTVEGDDDSCLPLTAYHLVHCGIEANGAHDAVTKLLIKDGLNCLTAMVDGLMQPVQRGLLQSTTQGTNSRAQAWADQAALARPPQAGPAGTDGVMVTPSRVPHLQCRTAV